MTGFIQRVDDNEYQKRIQRHKRQKFLLVASVVVVLAVICVLLVNAYINRTFNAYEVSKSVERGDSGTVQYYPYKEQILRVSRDGTSAMDAEGNVTFDGSYEMNQPIVDICEDYIVVADKGAYDLYVFDGQNAGKKLTMTLPILQVKVARQGVVAVLMEDKNSSVIQVYRTDETIDNLLVNKQLYVDNSGFPISMDLSQDGKKMVTCYIRVKNGILQNQVTFYSFSEVGQNDVNNMVGMKDYESTIVADVAFIGNDTVCVYTESGFELFTMTERNKELYQETFDTEIVSVVSNDSYIGFVLKDATEDSKYQVVVYDASGSKVLTKKIDYSYGNVLLVEKEMIFYSQSECHILKLNGVEKFSYLFTGGNVATLLPINQYNKYYLVQEGSIDIIKLTEE